MAMCTMARALSFVRISTTLNLVKQSNIEKFPKILDILPVFDKTQNLKYLSSKPMSPYVNKKASKDEGKDSFAKPERKMKVPSPKITLINPDNSLTVMTLEEAQKVAKRHNLKLVKIVDIDTKTQRATYKLMTGTEYFQEEMKRKEEKSSQKNNLLKSTKLMVISSRIAEYDLIAKIKNINKWLVKKHDVRILISVEGNKKTSEIVFQRVIKETKDNCQLINNNHTDGSIKFHLQPLLNNEDSLNENPASSESTPENHA